MTRTIGLGLAGVALAIGLVLVLASRPDEPTAPRDGPAELAERAWAALASGELERSIEDWERALTVDPDDARARGYLARAHEQLNRYREIMRDQRVATRDW